MLVTLRILTPSEVAIPSPQPLSHRSLHYPPRLCFSLQGLGEAKSGFWGLLALKARSILDDDIIMSPTPHTFAQGLHTPQVAMATAAKAKLLLRQLKTVKADLAFAKARCAQLEEEEKLLRDKEGRDKGQNRADDDLIRLQLETLLAEKARLASENEIYSRENRFLREIVEYHQPTMQDVIYLDEGMEQVSEFYPVDSDEVTMHRALALFTTR
ncbi:hypothetical protein K1719_043770 [Acacia pycnantha]|nr:hypothetical protein K1719_043770 [Acacia pycnantha]